MSFISPIFFLWLAPAGFIFYALPGRFRAVYLLAVSYAFYGLASRFYLALLIAASAATYVLGLGIARSRREAVKSGLMALGIAVIVAIVVAFKAAGAWRGFLLPLGISYYSFKLIAYLIEAYWDEDTVERDPVLFFLYPAFFPQIVSGPIQRPAAFFGQMRGIMARSADDAQIEAGFRFILGGLMLKLLVADRLAAFIDTVDRVHGDYCYPVLLATVACYTLQLYADFAGYTNIALGIGKIFGIEGPPNFNAPFRAVNIQQMWRRWHMSLTSWLTDYLFTPLMMTLRGLGRLGLVLSIAFNMVIIGLWHGFTLTYLVFGLLHAVFMIVTTLVLARAARLPSSARVAVPGAILTFSLMSFSQIFFHASSWNQAVSVLRQVLLLAPSGTLTLWDAGPGAAASVAVCAALALYAGLGTPGAAMLAPRLNAVAPRWVQYGVCLFLLCALSTENAGQFIYGQF